jgi:hypothetical protein
MDQVNELPLNPDVLFYLCKNHPSACVSLSETTKPTRKIALRCFQQADYQILNAFPSHSFGIDNSDIPLNDAIKIFMRLVNQLHDEAQRLDADPRFSQIPSSERLGWEYANFKDLVQKIQIRTEAIKLQDFHTFVKAIAQEIHVAIPPGTDLMKFWHDVLKKDERIKNIENLSLVGQNIRFLPPEIGSLSNLKALYLGSNKLKELPSELASLSQLQILVISDNQFDTMPGVLTSLSNLQHLRMNDNKIKALPSGFTFPSKLEYLDLSGNPLGKIPDEIVTCSNLTYLYLNNIELKEISTNLKELSKLKELYLSNNQVSEISKKDSAFPSRLKTLYLYGNPLSEKAKEFLSEYQEAFPLLSIGFDGSIAEAEDHSMAIP